MGLGKLSNVISVFDQTGVVMSNKKESNVLQYFDLCGRVALVTGAGGYLGSAFASALAEAGCRVICTSRCLDRAAAVAASLVGAKDLHHFGLALDQLDAASIDRCMERTIQEAGQIDVLVNNANEAT